MAGSPKYEPCLLFGRIRFRAGAENSVKASIMKRQCRLYDSTYGGSVDAGRCSLGFLASRDLGESTGGEPSAIQNGYSRGMLG